MSATDGKTYREDIDDAAKRIWETLNESQKAGVRVGMVPYSVMKDHPRTGSDLAVALVKYAERDGGMTA